MYSTTKNEEITNYAKISGMALEAPRKSHTIESEVFYEFRLSIERLSKIKDIIPVTVSERLLDGLQIKEGSFVEVVGEYRSYNKILNDKSRLVLHLFAKNLQVLDMTDENLNEVTLTGFICKPPVYRKTPFDREICDVLVAVNRPNFHKSDYVPCIMWGRNARFISNQEVGAKINLTGRIQSREYTKQNPDGTTENKTAYEVSCQKISLLANVSAFAKDEDENSKVVNW